MTTINRADRKQLCVKIPSDLVDAVDARCRETGRSRAAEVVLALSRYLASPIDGAIAALPQRTGNPTTFTGEIPADLVDALVERSRVSLRTLRVEVRVALEKHLARPAEPLAQKREQLKGPKGRFRQMSPAPAVD